MRLIDADALADRLYKLSSEYPKDETILRIIAGGLRHDRTFAPTIEAEPVKHGRWVEHICFDDGFWVCSNCRFVSQATAAPKLYRYCPNCGARMDGDENV